MICIRWLEEAKKQRVQSGYNSHDSGTIIQTDQCSYEANNKTMKELTKIVQKWLIYYKKEYTQRDILHKIDYMKKCQTESPEIKTLN